MTGTCRFDPAYRIEDLLIGDLRLLKCIRIETDCLFFLLFERVDLCRQFLQLLQHCFVLIFLLQQLDLHRYFLQFFHYLLRCLRRFLFIFEPGDLRGQIPQTIHDLLRSFRRLLLCLQGFDLHRQFLQLLQQLLRCLGIFLLRYRFDQQIGSRRDLAEIITNTAYLFFHAGDLCIYVLQFLIYIFTGAAQRLYRSLHCLQRSLQRIAHILRHTLIGLAHLRRRLL